MIEAVLKPRWKHDLERAQALTEALSEELETEDVDMSKGNGMSAAVWEIVDELHDIAVRYIPEGRYDDDD